MQCPNCGNIISQEDLFCGQCGLDLASTNVLHTVGMQTGQSQQTPDPEAFIPTVVHSPYDTIDTSAPTVLARKPKQSFKITFERGLTLHRTGAYKDALAAFDEAIRIKPNHAEAHYRRAEQLFILHLLAEAVSACDDALRIDPNHLNAIGLKSSALDKIEEVKKLIIELDRQLQIDPNNAETYIQKGLQLTVLGRYEDALSAIEEALRINPNDANALFVKSEIMALNK